MQAIPKDQVIKRFQSLPESLQAMVFSEKLSEAIKKYCNLRDIEENKIRLVGRLTGRVLLGYLRPELLAAEIQKETGVDLQKAQAVAHDLDAEIFSAVRLELKKLYPPTIQTPTVQSWMSQTWKTPAPPAAPAPSASSGQIKPKYVIPIPEKFLKQSVDARKSNMARSDLQQPAKEVTPVSGSKTNGSENNIKSAGGGTTSIPEKFLKQETRPPAEASAQADNLKPETQNQKPINQSGEVGFTTTGTLGNSTSSSQRQTAKEAVGSQVAAAQPHARPDLQQPIKESAQQFSEIRPPTTNSLPQPQTQKATNSATTGRIQQAEVIPQPTPISGSKINISSDNAKSAGGGITSPQPEFKPIVPLPTFIQTQFKTTQVSSKDQYGETRPPTTGSVNQPGINRPQIASRINDSQQAEVGSPTGGGTTSPVNTPLANDQRIKDLISKFASSPTQKPKPPAESPYREKL